MSGPIIRKYGFANYEKIFGERPLEHGIDEDTPASETTDQAVPPEAPKKSATKKKSTKAKKE